MAHVEYSHFASDFGADMAIIQDIGMESKGLEFSEYITKESLAQQGGYRLALKGPQHDETWLIFLDMVHNFMPTFENKAEALHWFPMFRTLFWSLRPLQTALERYCSRGQQYHKGTGQGGQACGMVR